MTQNNDLVFAKLISNIYTEVFQRRTESNNSTIKKSSNIDDSLQFKEHTDISRISKDAIWQWGPSGYSPFTGKGSHWTLEYIDLSSMVILGSAAILDNVLLNGGTFELWINGSQGSSQLLGNLLSKGWEFVLGEFVSGFAKLRFKYSYNFAIAQWDTINNVISLNTWHHVAVSFNATTEILIIYVDGIIVSTSIINAPSGTPGSDAGNLLILRDFLGNKNLYRGFLRELRVWNDIRTQSEIQDNRYTKLIGTETNLVGYWRIDEGTGITLTDITSNANDGTIFFGETWTQHFIPDLYVDVIPELQGVWGLGFWG